MNPIAQISKRIFICVVLILVSTIAMPQCEMLELDVGTEFPSSCDSITMTMIRDQLDRPYLYVANKDAGLTVYDISSELMVAALPISMLDDLDVMSLHQQGSLLLLALGSHFTDAQGGGMALVDVESPGEPKVLDVYTIDGSVSGAGIVRANGDFAYLGAMKNGLHVLDISDPQEIEFVSEYVPDIDFPVEGPNPDFYNARGMAISGDTLYLCYDAGGLHILDVSDKENVTELGKYANPALFEPFNLPRAYNNVVLNWPYAYVAVDYCGVEVLDISDPSQITLVGWWNPFGCPENNWFSSPAHTNEIHLDTSCELLFVSGGKTDLIVLDISDPVNPDSCFAIDDPGVNEATWGVHVYDREVYLSYICAIIPFVSTYSGVRVYEYGDCTSSAHVPVTDVIDYYPNPASGLLQIELQDATPVRSIRLVTAGGRAVAAPYDQAGSIIQLDVSGLPSAIYIVQLTFESSGSVIKIVVSR